MNIIAYYRVSTKKQGESGLGLEAQRIAVQSYAERCGAKIVREYTEVESGKRCNRPQLAKALSHAKRAKARLVVAKLDRLARNVAFLSALMESKVDFVAVDNQQANTLTLHILAAVAEAEAKMISERTKAGLAVAKAKGRLLGSARPGHWNGREELRQAGLMKAVEAASAANSQAAEEAYRDIRPMMLEMRESGSSLSEICRKLNGDGFTTRRGRQWSVTQVGRVIGAA